MLAAMPGPVPKSVGKYQVLERLATGGMAELYKARVTGQHGFEKLVAIKKILPHLAAARDEHVPRRDVAVDDRERRAVVRGRGVRVVERVEDVVHDQRAQRGGQPHLGARALAQQAEHVDAIDELHRDVRRVGVGAELEDLDDLRVIELCRDARLVDEHRDELRVGGEVRQDLLDRDQLLEAVLAARARLEQLGHAADRQALEHLVLADLLRHRPRRHARILRSNCRTGTSAAGRDDALTRATFRERATARRCVWHGP